MSQAQLDREVARVTGESVDIIRRMGFGPLTIPAYGDDTERAGRMPILPRRRARAAQTVPPELLRRAA